MEITAVKSLDDLDQYLVEHGLGGSWRRAGGPQGGAQRGALQARASIWKWDEIHEALLKAGEVVNMDQVGDLAGRLAGRKQINKLGFGVQILMPGEVAEAHRHTQAGLRFIVKGNPRAVMVVEGEAFPMEDGDLITTPQWAWHDYRNDGDEPVFWLDSLDLHLARLAYVFREVFPEPTQPLEKPEGYSDRTWGQLRPSWIESPLPTPPFRYPWGESYGALQAMKESEEEPDPYDGYHAMYTHPITNGPTVPALAAELQLLPPGFKTRSHRHNSRCSSFVLRGEGATVVEGERIEWSRGDIFVVPGWAWHQHENRLAEDAVLYTVTDAPTMEAWGFYREELGA